MNATVWAIIWGAVVCLILLAEGVSLGTGHAEYTFSHFVRTIRFNEFGRYLFLPLWCWLTLHFVIAPRWAGTHPTGWRDALAILAGLLWAYWEGRR